MDRLAEQVVAWHNRHPLAKRITIYDVHTIGVVALPFMRSGGSAASAEPVEPVLTDEISADSLAAAWGENDSTIAAHPNAAHLDALADQEDLPAAARPSLRDRLARLVFWRRGKPSATSLQAWPAFSERFVGGLSPRRIANFAKTYGYTTKPGDASWPQRVVAIDDAMMAAGSAAGGSWPFELYLMSAAVDAGSSRTRILAGHGRGPVLLGKRCLSPMRVGLLALLLLSVAGMAAALWWPRGSSAEHAEAATADGAAGAVASATSSAASAPEPMASASEMAAASVASAVTAEPPPAAASEMMAASAPDASASMPAMPEPASAPAPETTPNIRPQIALPNRPAKASELAAEKPAAAKAPEKAAEKAAEKAPEKAAEAAASLPTMGKSPSKAVEQALSGKPVVALVGPISPNKAEAEALLERMRKLIAPTQADPKALQGQVFQTPEGWRAAVWPFGSREEAQLINATLVARGMRTRAVDF